MTQTLTGSTFSVSAAAPSDQAAATYAALSWTEATAAEILDYQGPKPEWNTRTDETYNAAAKAEKKTTRSMGAEVVVLLEYLKSNNAFWDIITTADLASPGLLSCRFAHANTTDFRYFQAQVKSSGEIQGSADNILQRDIIMLPQVEVVKVDA
tara:strand:+ start:13777 stop:14235 length:459 start_codon:yes stop_codon:yes gene_type:complete